MKALIRFSSQLLPMANPKPNPPWSRYRHGCDPPNSRIGCECLPPFSTPHQLFVEPYSAIFSIPRFLLTELRLFKNFILDGLDICKPPTTAIWRSRKTSVSATHLGPPRHRTCAGGVGFEWADGIDRTRGKWEVTKTDAATQSTTKRRDL
jgi:hypothetical protein